MAGRGLRTVGKSSNALSSVSSAPGWICTSPWTLTMLPPSARIPPVISCSHRRARFVINLCPSRDPKETVGGRSQWPAGRGWTERRGRTGSTDPVAPSSGLLASPPMVRKRRPKIRRSWGSDHQVGSAVYVAPPMPAHLRRLLPRRRVGKRHSAGGRSDGAGCNADARPCRSAVR